MFSAAAETFDFLKHTLKVRKIMSMLSIIIIIIIIVITYTFLYRHWVVTSDFQRP